MFNWQVKQEMTAQNAIFLAEIGDNNGRPFKSRFLQAGLVKYDFGVCLLKKETIDKFVNTFINQPVIIGHKDTIIERDVVGYVHNIWFSPEDGWFWCDGTLKDEEAIKLVEEKGFNVSCQYRITEYTNNEEDKLHNGNPYDKEIINGIFEHLALVECPRYEDAFIAVNAYIAENEFKEEEHPRDEEGKFTEKANNLTPIKINKNDIPKFDSKKELSNWVKSEFEKLGTVKIEDTDVDLVLSSSSADRETFKRRAMKEENKAVYSQFEKIVKSSIKKTDRNKDENHIKDQEIYYNKFQIIDGENIEDYEVEIFVDKPYKEDTNSYYAGHRASKIIITPRDTQVVQNNLSLLTKGANTIITSLEIDFNPKTSNSFVEVFRNMLYETLAEGIYERLGEYIAQNEERWITIHPHGEDSEDYRRLKLEGGETPKEAIDRVYKKEDKKESEKKKEDKKGLLKENAVEEKIEEARKKFDEQSQEYTKIVKEINDYENNVYKQMEKIEEIEERNKFFENYRKEHKEEEEKLIEKRNKAYENYLEAEKRYEKFKEELANEYLQIDVENLDKEEFDNFIHNLKRLKYISGIEYSTRQKIQAKIEETTTNKDKKEVKERADKIGGYTKKLNDLCGFTELSDISAFPETLQKHIYDNYKQVYDKYPQIKYGGIQKYHLSSNTYAQNTSVRNSVVLNSLFYDDLDKLKESYERTVKSQFHPQGTDYNSIIVHELGHALLEYITKKTGKTGAEIRDKVLKKLKIKQKDVKEHLSEYAMYKPRKAHEFFAEAFAEYMTSKSPRPLAVEFGKEINNILEVYKLN